MLPLSLDVSNPLKCFCILRGGTEFPEFSIYSSLRALGAVVPSFSSGSSSTIVSICWSESRGIIHEAEKINNGYIKHRITQQESSSVEFRCRLGNTKIRKLR